MPQPNWETRLRNFWKRVDMSGECWLWRGTMNDHGYGMVRIMGRQTGAHRFAYQITHGDLRDEDDVCHKCDTPACVRPDHLFLGDAKLNVQDMIAKGRMPRGEQRAHAKLTATQVRDILQSYYTTNISMTRLAETHGVTPSLIGGIVHRKTWRHIPMPTEAIVVRREHKRGTRGFCVWGHKLEHPNLYVRSSGMSECLVCKRRRNKEYRQRVQTNS